MDKGNGSSVAWSGDDLAEIAQWQRYMIWLVIAQVQAPIFVILQAAKLSALNEGLPAYLAMVLCIGFTVFGVYFAYGLARSVRERAAALYAFLVLLPVVNILVLLVLNNIATGILRGSGIRVGMKGANPADLALKQAGGVTAPRVDKLRIVAFVAIVGFLLVVVLATMNLMTDLSSEDLGVHHTTRPAVNVVGPPSGQTRVITAPAQGAPAPPSPGALAPNAPGAAPTQPETAPGRPVIVANTNITIGRKTVIRAPSPRSKYDVVFEDNGETGYFYGLDRENAQNPNLDALHIYNAASVKDRTRPVLVQIIWSANGMQAAIFIDGYAHAVFDFEARRGYCRTGFPAPNQQFTKYTHEWNDDALRFFR